MSRAGGLVAEVAMAEEQQPAPSLDAQKAMAYLPSFVRRVSAHQFLLAELPPDLRDALADYDVDGDGASQQPARTSRRRALHACVQVCLLLSALRAGTVTVGEIAAGAHLLRRQKKKARAGSGEPRFGCLLT